MAIIVLCGRSGAGKTTLAGLLLKQFPKQFNMVTSLTTRPPRNTDLPGEYEQNPEQHLRTLDDSKWLLWLKPHGGALYGTDIWQVCAAASPESKRTGIMLLTPDVLRTLQKYLKDNNYPPAKCFYINTSAKNIRARTEDPARLVQRKNRAKAEKNWPRSAQRASAVFIDNNGTIENTLAQLLRELGM